MDADWDSFYYVALWHTPFLWGCFAVGSTTWLHQPSALVPSPTWFFFCFLRCCLKTMYFFYSYLIIEYFLIENALNNWKTYLTKKAFYSSLWLQNPSAKQHRSELNLGQLMWQLMKWICSLWCSLLERYHCSYIDLAVRVGCGEPQWKRHRLHCVSCPMLHDTHSGTDQFQ